MEKIKPDHYFGIKTSWTLKSEFVSKKTHKLSYSHDNWFYFISL